MRLLQRTVYKAVPAVLICLCSTASARADLALDFSGGTFNTAVALNTLGWEFTISQPMSLTALGFFDAIPNGIAGGHTVALWANSGGAPLAQVIVTSSSSPIASISGLGRWLFEPLAMPVALPIGDYVVGAYYASGADPLYSNTTTLSLESGVTFIHPRFTSSASTEIAFPPGTTLGNGFYGPNLMLVPEPSTVILFALGAIGLLIGRRL